MAKRRRLTPARSDYLDAGGAETGPQGAVDAGRSPATRPPISQVAGDTAATAALEEMSQTWRAAREEGRLVQDIPLDRIMGDHLIRDRTHLDEDGMQALIESLRNRGQQTPVDVVALEDGQYGLISGWRRLTALKRLLAETGEPRFGTVRALLCRPETAAASYLAMVEENEIRIGLSYYERARVAAKAVEQGVFDSEKAALLSLFSTASRAKRSKIRSFLTIYHALDGDLRFAAAVPERLGLSLSKALSENRTLARRIRKRLAAAPAETPEAELQILQAVLTTRTDPKPSFTAIGEVRGVRIDVKTAGNGRELKLSGPGVTDALSQQILDWLRDTS
ncbi:ParB N-terminal domain-containing protein [Thalassococcus sp. S3]|uniref:ParB/RepB/Spo0J family partition protein n=1 Tax=Thalassococcus sp. S3 TaxID=2017482 RepID=UPI0010248972|nr:ParB N-terminal domain-containing protein [Thalassococcus sp. S3]QBF34279.1 nuclease [Thalassococcus sp. S3]